MSIHFSKRTFGFTPTFFQCATGFIISIIKMYSSIFSKPYIVCLWISCYCLISLCLNPLRTIFNSEICKTWEMNLEKLWSNVHNLHSIRSAKCIEEMFNLILKISHSVFLEIRQKKHFQAAMKTKESVFICMLKLHFNVAAFPIEIQNSIWLRIVFVCAHIEHTVGA